MLLHATLCNVVKRRAMRFSVVLLKCVVRRHATEGNGLLRRTTIYCRLLCDAMKSYCILCDMICDPHPEFFWWRTKSPVPNTTANMTLHNNAIANAFFLEPSWTLTSLFYLVISTVGAIGNGSTLIAILRNRRHRTVPFHVYIINLLSCTCWPAWCSTPWR
ncbi:hypothetical protein BV898_15370 [Hypsibius exemplaris]|uniref:G-protein coupled receptors family 1 profile domain-containing protein n=1 Tax=Hypsibius exemplaris TaxID=2072580 RepID=A0A9X6NAS7_HYPEX|nr:hypothetical protein BV898_15370 [Hypsibius exemplaris]